MSEFKKALRKCGSKEEVKAFRKWVAKKNNFRLVMALVRGDAFLGVKFEVPIKPSREGGPIYPVWVERIRSRDKGEKQ